MADSKRPQSQTFLFSGYARLPQDVSHQAVRGRVGVILEVDELGIVVDSSSTLMTSLARDYFSRLLAGRSVMKDRQDLEDLIRYRYRGHSQGALIFALRRVFEAVDQSPLAALADGPPRAARAASCPPGTEPDADAS
jgi:hypothetical protein